MMFNRTLKGLAVAFMMAAGIAAAQQESFTVATGDSKSGSTYSQMFRELKNQCGAQLQLNERETKGSVENVALLTGNQVNAAIVQSDLLFFTRMTDPAKVQNVRTLVGLHPEELHFIARGDVKKEGGFMGIGGKEVVFRSVEDLAGRTIGAVGGSVLSGRVFAAQSKLNFQVREFPDNAQLTAALLKGEIDTILIVAGSPSKAVAGLDTRFRILPVTPAVAKAVEGVYSRTKISYSNMGAAGVDTVATQALLVTRTYRSKQMTDQLAKFRGCFENQLGNIQDKTGTHPKWQDVDSANLGKWEVYALPASR
jgi:uncharacterized protein